MRSLTEESRGREKCQKYKPVVVFEESLTCLDQSDLWHSQSLTWRGSGAWWQAGTARPPPLAGALERDVLLRTEERRLQQSTNKTPKCWLSFSSTQANKHPGTWVLLGSQKWPRSASCAAEFVPVVVLFLYKIPAFWKHSTDKNMAKLSVINISKKYFLGRRCWIRF